MKTLEVSSFVSSLFTWNRCLEIVSKFLLKYYIIAEPPPPLPPPPAKKRGVLEFFNVLRAKLM